MPTVPPLTRRETQICDLVARGLPNKQIAYAAGLSENTVKIYVSHVLKKLGVGNRTELAIRWIQKPEIFASQNGLPQFSNQYIPGVTK